PAPPNLTQVRGSNLPTSLPYIVLVTRGCSPLGALRGYGDKLYKKNTFPPGPPSTSPVRLLSPHWSQRTFPRVRVGNINPFPFGRSEKTEQCLRFGDALASERFLRSLRTDPHVQLLFTGNPSPASVPRFHLSFCYYPKDRPGGGSRRAHARPFNARHRDPPTHCGETPPRGKLCRGARYGPQRGRSSFSGCCWVGIVKLLSKIPTSMATPTV
ncbi:hypothetical protein JTE90_015823, partial [Oedothorax gibbosus]